MNSGVSRISVNRVNIPSLWCCDWWDVAYVLCVCAVYSVLAVTGQCVQILVVAYVRSLVLCNSVMS